MAIIQSGASSTVWTIDPTSNAGRVTVYDQYGNATANINSLSNIFNAFNDEVTVILGGQSTIGISVSGTTGTLTLSFEATIDNNVWFSLTATSVINSSIITSTTTDGQWVASTSGYYAVRTRISAYTSGSMTVGIVITSGQSKTAAQSISGTVTSDQGDAASLSGGWPVKITDGINVLGTNINPLQTNIDGYVQTNPNVFVENFPTIQDVSGVGDFSVVQTTAANLNATVIGTTAAGAGASIGLITIQGNALGTPVPVTGTLTTSTDGYVTSLSPIYDDSTFQPLSLTTAGALRVDGSSTIQPVSGTGNFTVVQAIASNLNATVTQGTSPWVENISQFGGSAVVTGIGASGAGIPRVTVSNDSNILATQSGTWTVQPGNTANTTPWLSTISQGGNSATVTGSNALKVDGSAVTQPISGTVTANAGTGSFTVVQATAANLNATVTGTIAATQSGTWTNTVTQATASNLRAQTSAESATGASPPANAVYVGGLVTTATESGLTNNDMYPISLTTTGLLRVDGSNVTQPISGTITANAGTGSFTVVQATAANLNATVTGTVAATQSGTWTVQPGNTANTTPWLATINQGGNSATVTASNALKIDGSAVTQPVSGTVTANAGTGSFTVAQATAANLNATVVGTTAAGFGASSGLFTVQGNALGTPIPVTGTLTTSTDGYATTAAPSYGNNTFQPLSLTTVGALRIDGSAVTQPVSGTVTANAGTGNFTVIQSTASNLNATVNPIADSSFATQNITVQDTNSSSSAGANGASYITGTPTVGSTAAFSIPTKQSLSVQVTGTWTGTLTLEASIDGGTTWFSHGIKQNSASYIASSFTGNFIGGLNASGATNFRVRATAAWTGTATVLVRETAYLENIYVNNPLTLRDSTTQSISNTIKAASTSAIAADTALVVAPSPNTAGPVQIISPNELAAGTSPATVFPAGFLRTSDEPHQVFYDPFDGTSIDGGNWIVPATAAGGGVISAVSAGNLTLGTGTTAGGYSYLLGGTVLRLTVPSWLGISHAIAIENPVTANTYRFWGQGSIPGTPTASSSTVAGTSVVNGIGWEIGTDGKLLAVVWSNSSRTIIQDLSSSGSNKQPVDGNFHRYICYIRTDKIYWYIDSLDTPVATSSFQSPQIQTLANLFMAIAGSVAPSSSGVITCAGVANWDTGKNNFTISDGFYGFRKATVTSFGALKVDGTGVTLTVAGPGTDNSTNSTSKIPVLPARANTSSPSWADGNQVPLSTDLTGNLRVTGTVATTQSGTWTVQPGNTANTTPWLTTINQGGNSVTVTGSNALKVDATATTQPVNGTVTSNQGSGNIISNSWSTKISDSINGPVAVKAASTAATVTDPSLVVSVSPNSPLPTGSNILGSIKITDGTNTLGTNSNPLIIDTVSDGMPATQNITAQDVGSTSTVVANSQNFITGTPTAGSVATFSTATDETIKMMISGTWTGTLTAEISMDSGTTWVASDVHQTGSPYTTNSFTGNFVGGLNISGCTNFRVRATAAWTGTATVRIIISDQTNSVYVASPTSLRDATIQSNFATIKSASTQSVATDPALVVALSPGSAQTRASTPTITTVAASTSSQTILAANSARLGAIITNSSTSILYLRYGSGAAANSAGNYTVQVAISGGIHELPFGYTGQITGIWTNTNGFVNVTEITL